MVPGRRDLMSSVIGDHTLKIPAQGEDGLGVDLADPGLGEPEHLGDLSGNSVIF